MKAEYINPFIEATFSVFSTMVNMKPKKDEVYLKEDRRTTYDVSGVIGLAGDIKGSVIISLPENLALKIVSNFLGEEKKTLDYEVVDGVGEILNMIAGGAKKIFGEKLGTRFKISIPSLIIGKGHIVNIPSGLKYIGVRYSLENEKFSLEVSMREENNSY
ncbi:MAG: chemotaxis protein CheX [Deferribacterota bacterium]|nr:chemotaxis protein CheX [Deferribacterota bacterium]